MDEELTDTADHDADMLECEQSKTDALEGIQAALEALAKKTDAKPPEVKPPVVNVGGPVVHVPAQPAAAVTFNEKPRPKGGTGEITRGDGSKSKFTFKFEY